MRGAYGRQVWHVTVGSGKRPLLLLASAMATTVEGELLEIPVGSFDADGDAVLVWAENLPSGASFDPLRSVLRWQPDVQLAGRYSLRLLASDGKSRTSRDLEIVVVNANQPPQLGAILSIAQYWKGIPSPLPSLGQRSRFSKRSRSLPGGCRWERRCILPPACSSGLPPTINMVSSRLNSLPVMVSCKPAARRPSPY